MNTESIIDTAPHERPLSLEQAGKFQSLQVPFDNVGIMSGSLQGLQVGIMFAEDAGKVEPLAVMVDKEFMAKFKGQFLDMNGNEVVPQMPQSLIFDPLHVDKAMVESVMSNLISVSR